MRTKVRIVIVADVDLDEYRAEYGVPEYSAQRIKEAVRADIVYAAQQVYTPIKYGAMVRVSQALR